MRTELPMLAEKGQTVCTLRDEARKVVIFIFVYFANQVAARPLGQSACFTSNG
jgi:hypothetical protein